MTDITGEGPSIPLLPPRDARRRAIELYKTTNLSVTAIAIDVGVSRDTVYRWLRKEGLSLGRNGQTEQAQIPTDSLSRISEEVADLRREQIILIGRIGRLEGLIEALVGFEYRPPNEEIP